MLKKLGKGLIVLAFAAYPILLHTYILKDEVEAWRLLLVFAPLLIVAGWMIFNAVAKIWWPLVAGLLAAAIYYFVTGEHGRVGLLAVNGLSHASFNLFLLWLFGRTLLPGQEPLISQISRIISGHLPPDIARYTRMVTIVWCLFFGLQIVISLLLYIFASTAAWSFFINVLNTPLLLLLLVGEFAYRKVHLPHHPRASIMKAIEVYTKHFAAPKKD